MRSLLFLLFGLLLTGCATVPGFQTGWLERLPENRIDLAVFVYPLHDARPVVPHRLPAISDLEAVRIQAATERSLVHSLKKRGVNVTSTLSDLRPYHAWSWDWTKGVGSEPEPYSNLSKMLAPSSAEIYALSVKTYVQRLRARLQPNSKVTTVIVCVAAHLTSRDGPIEYPTPVYVHRGLSTERCNEDGTVVAVDGNLRLLAYSSFSTPIGATRIDSPSTFGSLRFTYHRSTPEQWGEMIAESVLERLRIEKQ